MRSQTLLSILFLAGCASGTSSLPVVVPAGSDAGSQAGSGNVGASADAGPAVDGGSDAGPAVDGGSDAGPAVDGGSDAGPAVDGGSDAGPALDGGSDAGPALDGGSDGGPALDGGSPDAGALAAHCDPALDPSAGVTLTGASSAPSCAGLAPALPSCAAEITLCAGMHVGSGGPTGNVTGRGESDGAGALALSCNNVDVGPSPGFTLYLDGDKGYVKGPHLGDDAWGLPSGLVALTTSYAQRPPPYYDFYTHGGALLGNVAQSGGRIYVSAATIEIVTPEPVPGGVQLFAQQVDVDGSPRGGRVAVSDPIATTTGVYLAGAADDRGGTLVLWGVYGQTSSSARWLDSAGQVATPVFPVAQSPDRINRAAGLTKGFGVALGDAGNGRWTGVVAPGTTTAGPPPAWLSSRSGLGLSLVRGGRALAFNAGYGKSVEVVAPDGTSCGTLSFPGATSVGTDGTVFAAVNEKTFRIYPQLLR